MESPSGKTAFAGVSLALVIAALALANHGNVGRQSFKAFYCAGVAVSERQSPYRVEPIRSCERRIAPSALPDGYVEPAPLPGYALAPFALLSMLPPRLAAQLFAVLLALAAVASAHCLAQIVPAPRAPVLLALAPLTLLNVAYGEIPPLALLGTCAAAYFLAKSRWTPAGIAVCAALLEPNVGLPAVVAVFFFAPRSRRAIALSVICLAVVSVAALGIDRNVEYVARTLPLMANAELAASDQYSLSHLLYAAGASPTLSLLAGRIWFVVAAAIGLIVAGFLAIRRRQPELLPLLPPAAVLLLGIYLHDIQMLLALPAALVIAARLRGDAFAAGAAAALALLIAVWTERAGRAVVLIDTAGVAGGLYAALSGPVKRRVAVALVTALATVAGVLLFQHAQPPLTAAQIVTSNFHAAPNAWAATAWDRYLRSTPALTRSVFALKIPTWIGLSLLMLCAFRMCVEATPIRSESREPLLANAPYSVFSQKYD